MRNAYIKLHLSVILAGFTGIFGKLITLSEGLLVWYRMLITAILFFLILKVSRKLYQVARQDVLRIGAVGFLLSLHWIFFYGSIKASNVSIGVICFSLTGFFTSLFEPLIDRKPFSFKEVLFSLIAVCGILFIFQFDSRYRAGIGLGVISSALCALYTVCNKQVSRSYPTATVLLYTLVGGFVCFSCIMPAYLWFFPQEVLLPNLQNLIYLLLFALFCTILLYILQIQVLKKISAFTVNLSYNLEPVYSIAIAMILFNEAQELNYSFYVGLGLIVLSVAMQSVAVSRQSTKPLPCRTPTNNDRHLTMDDRPTTNN